MTLEDLFGGSQQIDPAMGLALIRHPELIAQHLASLGHEPPGDVEEGGVTPQQAHQSLGSALAYNAPEEREGFFNPDNPILSRILHPTPSQPSPGMPAASPKTPTPFVPQGPQNEPDYVPQGPIGGDYTPQGPQAPTPAPESAAATGAAPAGDTSEKPGEVPVKHGETVVDDRKKKEPVDSLAAALAGLKAPQYQNPLHVSTPAAPRATNILSRSTVPQQLMQEIAGLGRPSSTFRLGEALRGHSFA